MLRYKPLSATSLVNLTQFILNAVHHLRHKLHYSCSALKALRDPLEPVWRVSVSLRNSFRQPPFGPSMMQYQIDHVGTIEHTIEPWSRPRLSPIYHTSSCAVSGLGRSGRWRQTLALFRVVDLSTFFHIDGDSPSEPYQVADLHVPNTAERRLSGPHESACLAHHSISC